MAWPPGNGHGLVVHSIHDFTVGRLNCRENWMPLARTALYAQGENVHVAVWPGSERNTFDISSFIAKESRSHVTSAGTIKRKTNIHHNVPYAQNLLEKAPEEMANGRFCIAARNGYWIIEAQVGSEGLVTAVMELNQFQNSARTLILLDIIHDQTQRGYMQTEPDIPPQNLKTNLLANRAFERS